MTVKPHILPLIIIAQFACTSPWFAGNVIIEELALKTGLGTEIIGWVLSSVQLGFIVGTLIFALLMVADRFSPSKVFMVCAVLAAICNFFLLQENLSKWGLLITRFGTGFFLAGIYPVGMKLASDYYEQGLGKALGFLVGALVLGTAFPYLINGTNWGNNPDIIIKTTSILCVLGGLIIFLLVPNGPYRKPSTKLNLNIGPHLFKILTFRKAAIGYFGHMWELYAFWAFTPFAINLFNRLNNTELSVPLWTGIIMALGSASCAIGGVISQYWGSKKVAIWTLTISGSFCLLSPLLFYSPVNVFMSGWCLWGMAVTADSPQFSSLVANALTPELKGTGLTLVNSIGFAISIISIQILWFLSEHITAVLLFTALGLGPFIGLWHLKSKKNN